MLRGVLSILVLVFLSGCGIGYGAFDFEESGPTYHRVERGESLSAISKRYGVSAESLALLNGIHDPKRIEVGQLLLISFSGTGERRVVASKQKAVGDARVTQARAFVPSASGRIGWPIGRGEIVSEFGTRGSSFHDGLDIAAPTGTPVYAAHDGVVAYSDNGLSGYGNLIILKAKTTMMTVYAHNSKLLVDLGEEVKRGDKIALVGESGHATGPHLHFEVRAQDRQGRYLAVDPLPLFQERSEKGLRYRINESLTPILAKLTR